MGSVADQPAKGHRLGGLIRRSSDGIDDKEDIDKAVLQEVRVERDSKEPAVAGVIHLVVQGEERNRKDASTLHDPDRPALFSDEHPPIVGEGHGDRRAEAPGDGLQDESWRQRPARREHVGLKVRVE